MPLVTDTNIFFVKVSNNSSVGRSFIWSFWFKIKSINTCKLSSPAFFYCEKWRPFTIDTLTRKNYLGILLVALSEKPTDWFCLARRALGLGWIKRLHKTNRVTFYFFVLFKNTEFLTFIYRTRKHTHFAWFIWDWRATGLRQLKKLNKIRIQCFWVLFYSRPLNFQLLLGKPGITPLLGTFKCK